MVRLHCHHSFFIYVIYSSHRVDIESDDEDDDTLLWHEQRKKIKESLQRTGQLPKDFTAPKPKYVSKQ